jgi:hypothetical protein
MKASQFLISTLKEAPADAEVVSHQLMMRAGMIKRLVSRADSSRAFLGIQYTPHLTHQK